VWGHYAQGKRGYCASFIQGGSAPKSNPVLLSGEAALYRPLEGVSPPHPLSQGGGALCGIF